MVNEVNKPPLKITENAQLEERLANSNRQLHAMQEEHRQLLEEMQMLRQRARELSQRNADHHITESISNEEIPLRTEATTEETPSSSSTTTASVAPVPTVDASIQETANNEEEPDDPETAEYLSQKLSEVAALKARLRRVQNMVDTTNLIENHVTKRTNENAIDDIARAAASPIVANSDAVTTQFEERSAELFTNMINTLNNFTAGIHNQPTATDEETATSSTAPDANVDANRELLSNMFTMFTDFTSDLRTQADDLRAERERIKALKEELQRRKTGGN